MSASTTTTIRGVSIFSRQRTRKADVFDIALSPAGIVLRRPGRTEQHMTWDRIAQWEVEERPGCVVLILRGGGSVTPLMVTGWTLQDLEAVMREVTGAGAGPAADEDDQKTPIAARADAPVGVAAAVAAPVQPRAARRQAARRTRRGPWRPLVTIVLLVVLATAVTLVLLQSAGVIDWSFLGPVA